MAQAIEAAPIPDVYKEAYADWEAARRTHYLQAKLDHATEVLFRGPMTHEAARCGWTPLQLFGLKDCPGVRGIVGGLVCRLGPNQYYSQILGIEGDAALLRYNSVHVRAGETIRWDRPDMVDLEGGVFWWRTEGHASKTPW